MFFHVLSCTELNVYCSCRLPHALEHLKCPSTSEATTMIKCYICDNLYHHNCVGITLERAKKMNAIKEMWFWNYKGCEEAFGDLFESDWLNYAVFSLVLLMFLCYVYYTIYDDSYCSHYTSCMCTLQYLSSVLYELICSYTHWNTGTMQPVKLAAKNVWWNKPDMQLAK